MVNSPEGSNNKSEEKKNDFDLDLDAPIVEDSNPADFALHDVPHKTDSSSERSADFDLDLDAFGHSDATGTDSKNDDFVWGSNEETAPLISASVDSNNESLKVKPEQFKLPTGLVEYVNDLIAKSDPKRDFSLLDAKHGRKLSPKGQKLAMLVFDLKFVDSEEKLAEVITKISKEGGLTREEFEKITEISGLNSEEVLSEKEWHKNSQDWLKNWNEQKKVGVKAVPVPESVVNSGNEDDESQQLAIDAYQNGNFYEIQKNLMKIKNPEHQSTAIGEIVNSLISDGKFDKAGTLADLIKDEAYRERLFVYIKNEKAKQKPQDVDDTQGVVPIMDTPENPSEAVIKTAEIEAQNPPQTPEKKETAPKIVNSKVFSVMDTIIGKIKPSEKAIFRELRDELSATKDYSEAEVILSDPKYAISIPAPERKKIFACFDKQSAAKVSAPEVLVVTPPVSPKITQAPTEVSLDELPPVGESQDLPLQTPDSVSLVKNEELPLQTADSDSLVKSEELNRHGPLTEKEAMGGDLGLARVHYLQAKLNFQNKTHEHLNVLQKIISNLGFSRSKEDLMRINPPSLAEAKKELDSALAEYINTKKVDRERIINTHITSDERVQFDPNPESNDNLEAVEGAIITWKLMDYADKEAEVLEKEEQRLIDEGASFEVKELKRLASKGLYLWNKVPPKKRLLAKSILLGATAGVTGGLLVGAYTAGSIAAKGGAGILGALGVGKVLDSRFEKTNKKNQRDREGQFINEGVSYEERELADMKKREAEAKIKKGQKIKKAMAQVVVGAGSGVLTGLAEGAFLNTYNSGGLDNHGARTSQVGVRPFEEPQKISAPDDVKSTDVSKTITASESSNLKEDFVGPKMPEDLKSDEFVGPKLPEDSSGVGQRTVSAEAPNLENPASLEHPVLPVNVEASSKGFMQDIINLKAKVEASYEGQEIPKGVQENLLNKSYFELAKEYGMYKAEDNLSGMSMKGAHLGVDSEGHLAYEYQGKSNTMFDYENGKVKSFEEIDGKMFSPDTARSMAEVGTVTEETAPQAVDIDPVSPEGVETPGIEAGIKTYTPPTEIPVEEKIIMTGDELISKNHIPFKNGTTIDLVPDRIEKGIVLLKSEMSTIKIGHLENVTGRGDIPVLEDKFFDGKDNAIIREAYNLAFQKNVNFAEVFGKNHTTVGFERGRLDIAHGSPDKPNELGVFLNGKRIATGVVTNKGTVLNLIDDPSSVKHHGFFGFLLPDTVYERAFKAAEKVIETMKPNYIK